VEEGETMTEKCVCVYTTGNRNKIIDSTCMGTAGLELWK
jgi:hypothetical protein